MTNLQSTLPTMIDGWNFRTARREVARWSRVFRYLGLALVVGHVALRAAEDVAALQKQFLSGQYDSVIGELQSKRESGPDHAEAQQLLIKSLLAVGRYPDADAAMSEALANDSGNIRLRWLAREVALVNGRTAAAALRADEVRQAVVSRSYSYRAPADLVVFGRAALLAGADPKEVLDKVYAYAQKTDPKLRDVYLARGELALEKHDAALAAKAFEEGLKLFPGDPDFHFGRAQAYADSDRKIVVSEIEAVLKLNPAHVPSLLLLAEHRIDAEDYAAALEILKRAERVNPWNTDLWAYRAVIGHVQNNSAVEATAREKALTFWRTNPRVDFLIGKKIAAKYRFAEAASAQRRALEFDPEYLPARAELANDLLRLGDETEGWKLARDVHARDEYDVEAFNLVTLEETMAKYATISNGDFTVRMSGHEATIYGPQVLELLTRARRQLTQKYGVELVRPTFVEIFAEQKDFAVRTFGIPDVSGFLGVCFGRVVTANSPAATPSNWQAVLWHEFCHVVTLQITENKMPRWLSEGISVHEETQANPAWGMRLNPRFREMIMGEDFVPVGELSGAFLAPPTPVHLQFAYFESALAVDFIVERYGQPALKSILNDLRFGTNINEAIAAHTVPMPELEKDFKKYAREKITRLTPKLDWEKPSEELLAPDAEEKMAAWIKQHPDNYWALSSLGRKQMIAKNWDAAKVTWQHLLELYPSQTGPDSAARLLTATYKATGDTAGEHATLVKWAAQDDDAVEAYTRLIELDTAEKDWAAVAVNAKRALAVNPLVAPPYRALGQASAELGDLPNAIMSFRTVLALDPTDPAEAHFQLAQNLYRAGDAEAKRQVLEALEEAPRYRAALDLLVEINRRSPTNPPTTQPTVALP